MVNLSPTTLDCRGISRKNRWDFTDCTYSREKKVVPLRKIMVLALEGPGGWGVHALALLSGPNNVVVYILLRSYSPGGEGEQGVREAANKLLCVRIKQIIHLALHVLTLIECSSLSTHRKISAAVAIFQAM